MRCHYMKWKCLCCLHCKFKYFCEVELSYVQYPSCNKWALQEFLPWPSILMVSFNCLFFCFVTEYERLSTCWGHYTLSSLVSFTQCHRFVSHLPWCLFNKCIVCELENVCPRKANDKSIIKHSKEQSEVYLSIQCIWLSLNFS